MRQLTRKRLLSVATAAGGVLAVSAGVAHADSDAAGRSAQSPGVLSGNTVQVPVHVPVNACGNTVNVVGVLNPAFGNTCVNGGGGHGDGHGGGGQDGGGHDGGGQGGGGQGGGQGGGNQHSGGAEASGTAQNSPGVGSGNQIQVPVDVPVNACGNNVSVVGVGNAAFGNECANGHGRPDGPPEHPGPEEPGPEEPEEPGPEEPEEPGPEEPEEPGPEEPGEPGEPEEPGSPGDEGPSDEPEGSGDGPGAEAPAPGHEPADTEPSEGALAETGAGTALGAALPLGAGLLLGGVVLYRRARLARLG
ncbi:chaplin [Streptomyces sp. 4N509B]|uniref:chaplin n=1 Tax=Streptomyces sp. 4N509B TaxID=3457413 RepID=UPI003FD0FDF9